MQYDLANELTAIAATYEGFYERLEAICSDAANAGIYPAALYEARREMFDKMMDAHKAAGFAELTEVPL